MKRSSQLVRLVRVLQLVKLHLIEGLRDGRKGGRKEGWKEGRKEGTNERTRYVGSRIKGVGSGNRRVGSAGITAPDEWPHAIRSWIRLYHLCGIRNQHFVTPFGIKDQKFGWKNWDHWWKNIPRYEPVMLMIHSELREPDRHTLTDVWIKYLRKITGF